VVQVQYVNGSPSSAAPASWRGGKKLWMNWAVLFMGPPVYIWAWEWAAAPGGYKRQLLLSPFTFWNRSLQDFAVNTSNHKRIVLSVHCAIPLHKTY